MRKKLTSLATELKPVLLINLTINLCKFIKRGKDMDLVEESFDRVRESG